MVLKVVFFFTGNRIIKSLEISNILSENFPIENKRIAFKIAINNATKSSLFTWILPDKNAQY